MCQFAGEVVVVFPWVLHCGWSTAATLAESSNYAPGGWREGWWDADEWVDCDARCETEVSIKKAWMRPLAPGEQQISVEEYVQLEDEAVDDRSEDRSEDDTGEPGPTSTAAAKGKGKGKAKGKDKATATATAPAKKRKEPTTDKSPPSQPKSHAPPRPRAGPAPR